MVLNKMIMNNYDKLNTMTKYPSIYTYHKIGKKGKLEEEILCPVDEVVYGYIYEKIDGTNCRIIMSKYDYIIGSREDLLYAKGDRIINKSMDIVKNLTAEAERIFNSVKDHILEDELVVFYGELYGGKVGKACKNYSLRNEVGFRVFDITNIKKDKIKELLSLDIEKISGWRENTVDHYYNNAEFLSICEEYSIKTAPVLGEVRIDKLPKSIEEMYQVLKRFGKTKSGIDNTGDAEGIIIRSCDRKYIRKIRMEEYKKTLGIKK